MPTNLNFFDTYRKTLADPARAAAVAGTLKVAIFLAFTPNQNTNQFYGDLVPATNEVVGTNYTARGNAAATPTWTMNASGVITFSATNPAIWLQNAAGFSLGRRAILYYDTGVDTTSGLVGYSDDFGANSGNVAGDFSVAFNASGVYTSIR
ncbi:MAG: hypothetical protein ABIT70_10840 [Sulfuriferula sp.]